MKKVLLVFFFYSFLYCELFCQTNTEIIKKLQGFYKQFASENMTESELIEKYGEPNSIERKKTGYLDDAFIYYFFDKIGTFTFLYKSEENITKLCFYKINKNEILRRNVPMTIDGIRDFFNFDFTLLHLEDKDITILGYFGDFTVNFQFKENELVAISWSIH